MFKKVLIANRGEIAVRIARTLREMGIVSVAGFSDADRDALFVLEADEAYRLGPPPAGESYLNIPAILEVARESGAEAIHPGYGFLAENADFARAVEGAGLTFIGPSPDSIRLMGDKVRARQAAQAVGVPVVPGTDDAITSLQAALVFGRQHGYPVAVKAAGGGGGRGIRIAKSPEEMEDVLNRARREAETYFKNPEVYLERYYRDPRHVEVQVLGDAHGNLVHLGERDCSIQRRHQKLIEEAPSPAVDRTLRERLGDLALKAAASASYRSAGTVEFLLTAEGDVFFLEMNTRIQVEHPVTEMVAGGDLIREMILVAAGEPLTVRESLVEPYGHSIEIRINAEDPTRGFQPAPQTISRYRQPAGIGVRMDSGVYQGFTIPQAYDSLMSKVIVWAPDRELARRRALRALGEYVIEGPATTIEFDRAVLESDAFIRSEAGTTFVESHIDLLIPAAEAGVAPVAGAPSEARGDERTFAVDVGRRAFTVRVIELDTGTRPSREARPVGRRASKASSEGPELSSPMHGTVLTIRKAVGDSVAQGDPLVVIEAMKMENEVTAHRSGVLVRLEVAVGDTVETGQPLARIE